MEGDVVHVVGGPDPVTGRYIRPRDITSVRDHSQRTSRLIRRGVAADDSSSAAPTTDDQPPAVSGAVADDATSSKSTPAAPAAVHPSDEATAPMALPTRAAAAGGQNKNRMTLMPPRPPDRATPREGGAAPDAARAGGAKPVSRFKGRRPLQFALVAHNVRSPSHPLFRTRCSRPTAAYASPLWLAGCLMGGLAGWRLAGRPTGTDGLGVLPCLPLSRRVRVYVG